MKTITYSLLFSLCFLLYSCTFNIDYPEKIKGKGEIITEQIVLESFKNVELKRGWKIILKPASSNYMVVSANENLFEVLEHENKAGNLVIGSSKQISSADSKQITLYFTDKLESLKVSSGTKVSSPEQLNFDDINLDLSSGSEVTLDLNVRSLDLETSSGSEVTLVLNVDDLFVDSSSGSSANLDVNGISTQVESSSGSDVFLKGSSRQFEVRTSSGSSVNSKAFESEKVTAKASSGSSISVYPIEDLKAETSSGGAVYYYNKPLGSLDLNKSKSGGSIKLK
ncbi:GIN domain-containing protein [Psychroflexus salinarum]|uniref:GIN domain-containing protein n=1 Tax=Psychroflexus salinarum TaxID=546024 RepID=A0ABW3GVC0_9FLAO